MSKIKTYDTFQKQVLESANDERMGNFFSFDSSGAIQNNSVTWTQHVQDAAATAELLQNIGLSKGSRVAILADTSRELATLISGAWFGGMAISVLPISPKLFGDIERLCSDTKKRVEKIDADIIVVDDLVGMLIGGYDFGVKRYGFNDVVKINSKSDDLSHIRTADIDGIAILQFTSGATSDPKPVAVTYDVLNTNLSDIRKNLKISINDVGFSWLPFFHDMGLTGCYALALSMGMEAQMTSPMNFIADPSRWMEWLTHFNCTMTAGPDFAYALAAKKMDGATNLDLSNLRMVLNGAERINPDTVRSFVKAAQQHGMSSGAIVTAYGMAEVGVAAAFSQPGRGLKTQRISVDSLEKMEKLFIIRMVLKWFLSGK